MNSKSSTTVRTRKRKVRAGLPAIHHDVVGCLPYKGKRKSIEEMDAAVAVEARRRRK